MAQLLAFAARAKTEDGLLSELVHLVRRLSTADGVDILLADKDQLVLRASTIAPEFTHRLRIPQTCGLAGQVFGTHTRVVVRSDLRSSPINRPYTGYDESEFDAAVIEPLVIGADAIGVMYFRRIESWKPTKNELNFLADLAASTAGILGVFRAGFVAGSMASKRIGAMSEVADILSRSPYLEEILQLLVNMTAQQFQYRVCTVRLLDEQNQELVLRATQATVKAYQRKRAIKLGESIAGRVIVEKTTAIVPDVQIEPDYIGHDLAVEQGLRSMICVPLLIQDRAVGVLTCYTDQVREFSEDEIKALETIAKQAAVSIEHAKLQVRTTLMQEMHHRVKNNLQQVVSLLRLQLRHSHYKNIEEAINDSLTRILAIAAVHDLLSREDLDHVGVRSIAETLVQHQIHSFIPAEQNIEFEVRGDDVRLNMTQATQMALILNELIANAVEHGFKEKQSGSIHVNVEAVDNEVRVWVSNNGDSLPPTFDMSSDGHLGLQIVSNLVRGSGGVFKIEDRLGWTVSEVNFVRASSE